VPSWLRETRVAPDNAPFAQDEVATATDGAPYRRKKARALMPIYPKPPGRVVVLYKTQFDRLAATARAEHRGTPMLTVLADEI